MSVNEDEETEGHQLPAVLLERGGSLKTTTVVI